MRLPYAGCVSPYAFLVDFDGTACLHDASNCLLDRFSDADWEAMEAEIAAGGRGLREMMQREAGMLSGDLAEMVAHNLAHCPMDPTFAPFVRWAEDAGHTVAIVSDGFGFNIPPLLDAVGVGHLPVISNALVPDADRFRLDHPSRNPSCDGCGTCKMAAVESGRADGRIAVFIGNGISDRWGAMHADVAFAKQWLAEICASDGTPYRRWEDFDDIRASLADDPPSRIDPAPGPRICAGWMPIGAQERWLLRTATEADDARRAYELYRADEATQTTELSVQLEDVLADWSRPSFDPTRDQIFISDPDLPDQPVGTAGIGRTTVWIAVHPDHHGRGIGATLARWAEREAMQRGVAAPAEGEIAIGQTIPDSATAAAALLRGRGWEPFYTAWVLQLPPDAPLADSSPPEGVLVRAPIWPDEAHACYAVIEEAFSHWPGRPAQAFEDWNAWFARDDFDPSLAVVAESRGEVVGAVMPILPGEFWIQQVAVRPDHQGRGIGTAMLTTAFRAGRRLGHERIGLSTDSRTGALGLYERVGMRVTASYTNHRKVLRPARDR